MTRIADVVDEMYGDEEAPRPPDFVPTETMAEPASRRPGPPPAPANLRPDNFGPPMMPPPPPTPAPEEGGASLSQVVDQLYFKPKTGPDPRTMSPPEFAHSYCAFLESDRKPGVHVEHEPLLADANFKVPLALRAVEQFDPKTGRITGLDEEGSREVTHRDLATLDKALATDVRGQQPFYQDRLRQMGAFLKGSEKPTKGVRPELVGRLVSGLDWDAMDAEDKLAAARHYIALLGNPAPEQLESAGPAVADMLRNEDQLSAYVEHAKDWQQKYFGIKSFRQALPSERRFWLNVGGLARAPHADELERLNEVARLFPDAFTPEDQKRIEGAKYARDELSDVKDETVNHWYQEHPDYLAKDVPWYGKAYGAVSNAVLGFATAPSDVATLGAVASNVLRTVTGRWMQIPGAEQTFEKLHDLCIDAAKAYEEGLRKSLSIDPRLQGSFLYEALPNAIGFAAQMYLPTKIGKIVGASERAIKAAVRIQGLMQFGSKPYREHVEAVEHAGELAWAQAKKEGRPEWEANAARTAVRRDGLARAIGTYGWNGLLAAPQANLANAWLARVPGPARNMILETLAQALEQGGVMALQTIGSNLAAGSESSPIAYDPGRPAFAGAESAGPAGFIVGAGMTLLHAMPAHLTARGRLEARIKAAREQLIRERQGEMPGGETTYRTQYDQLRGGETEPVKIVVPESWRESPAEIRVRKTQIAAQDAVRLAETSGRPMDPEKARAVRNELLNAANEVQKGRGLLDVTPGANAIAVREELLGAVRTQLEKFDAAAGTPEKARVYPETGQPAAPPAAEEAPAPAVPPPAETPPVPAPSPLVQVQPRRVPGTAQAPDWPGIADEIAQGDNPVTGLARFGDRVYHAMDPDAAVQLLTGQRPAGHPQATEDLAVSTVEGTMHEARGRPGVTVEFDTAPLTGRVRTEAPNWENRLRWGDAHLLATGNDRGTLQRAARSVHVPPDMMARRRTLEEALGPKGWHVQENADGGVTFYRPDAVPAEARPIRPPKVEAKPGPAHGQMVEGWIASGPTSQDMERLAAGAGITRVLVDDAASFEPGQASRLDPDGTVHLNGAHKDPAGELRRQIGLAIWENASLGQRQRLRMAVLDSEHVLRRNAPGVLAEFHEGTNEGRAVGELYRQWDHLSERAKADLDITPERLPERQKVEAPPAGSPRRPAAPPAPAPKVEMPLPRPPPPKISEPMPAPKPAPPKPPAPAGTIEAAIQRVVELAAKNEKGAKLQDRLWPRHQALAKVDGTKPTPAEIAAMLNAEAERAGIKRRWTEHEVRDDLGLPPWRPEGATRDLPFGSDAGGDRYAGSRVTIHVEGKEAETTVQSVEINKKGTKQRIWVHDPSSTEPADAIRVRGDEIVKILELKDRGQEPGAPPEPPTVPPAPKPSARPAAPAPPQDPEAQALAEIERKFGKKLEDMTPEEMAQALKELEGETTGETPPPPPPAEETPKPAPQAETPQAPPAERPTGETPPPPTPTEELPKGPVKGTSFSGTPMTGGVTGNRGTIKLADGTDLHGVYRCVDVDQLIPTHNPLDGFTVNENGDTNVRPYHDPVQGDESRRAVMSDAEHPDMAYLSVVSPTPEHGPPQVTVYGQVRGGNRRTMAAIVAYHEGRDAAHVYREGAITAAETFGAKAVDVATIEKPFWVFVMDEPGVRGDKLSRLLNEGVGKAAQSPETRAVGRGEQISTRTADLLTRFLEPDTGEPRTFREVMADPKQVKWLLDRLVEDTALTPAERTEMTDAKTGLLKPAGKFLLEEMLLGRIAADPSIMAALPDKVRQNLLASLGPIVRGLTVEEFGRSLQVALQAAPKYARARSPDSGEAEMGMDEYFFGQGTLLGPKPDIPGFGDLRVACLTNALVTKGPRQFKNAVEDCLDRMRVEQDGTTRKLGALQPPVAGSVTEAIYKAFTARPGPKGEDLYARGPNIDKIVKSLPKTNGIIGQGEAEKMGGALPPVPGSPEDMRRRILEAMKKRLPPTPKEAPNEGPQAQGPVGPEKPGGPGEPPQVPGGGRQPAPVEGRTGGPTPEAPRPGERRIIRARSEHTPRAPTDTIPEDLRKSLVPHQAEGAALTWQAIKTSGGFINADGTGAGKTSQLLTVAEMWRRQDPTKKVLIIAPKRAAGISWGAGEGKHEIVGGSYKDDAARLGLALRAVKGGEIKPGEIVITTYDHMKKFEPDSNTLIIFDEAHRLKNLASRTPSAVVGDQLGQKGGAVIYATATPIDKPIHLAYLTRTGILEGGTPEQMFRKLGIVMKRLRDGTLAWEPARGITLDEVYRRIERLFDRVTAAGKMKRDEVAMDGAEVLFHRFELTSAQWAILDKIEEELKKMAMPPSLKAAHILMQQRIQQENFKVETATDYAKREVDAGRSVVLFCFRRNEAETSRIIRDKQGNIIERRLIHKSEGTVDALRKALAKRGIEDVSEITGKDDMEGRAEAAKDFLDDKARVVIATIGAAGEGINLDAREGKRPRTLVIVTPPFTAVEVIQAMGRILRMTTRSNPRFVYLYTDHEVDEWLAGIVAKKVRTLGANVAGEVKNMEMLSPAEAEMLQHQAGPRPEEIDPWFDEGRLPEGGNRPAGAGGAYLESLAREEQAGREAGRAPLPVGTEYKTVEGVPYVRIDEGRAVTRADGTGEPIPLADPDFHERLYEDATSVAQENVGPARPAAQPSNGLRPAPWGSSGAETAGGKELLDRLHADMRKAGKHNVGMRAIVEFLNDAVGARMYVTKSQSTRRSPAHYMAQPHIIRSRAGGWQLNFHEAGHGLEVRITDEGNWGGEKSFPEAKHIGLFPEGAVAEDTEAGPKTWYKGMEQDLVDLTHAPDSHASAHTAREGMAEVVRRYVVDPLSIPDRLRGEFERRVQDLAPQMFAALRDAHRAYVLHRSRPLTQQMQTNIYERPPQPSRTERFRNAVWGLISSTVGGGPILDRLDRAAWHAMAESSLGERVSALYSLTREKLDAAIKARHDLARRFFESIKDTPADKNSAYHALSVIPQEISRAIWGTRVGPQGIRVFVRGEGFERFKGREPGQPDPLKALKDAGFAVPEGKVRHGDFVYLDNKPYHEIKHQIGERNWPAFEAYGMYRAALARYKAKFHEYPGLREGLRPEILEEHIRAEEKAHPDWPDRFEDVNRYFDNLLLLSVLSGEKTVGEAIRMKRAYEDYWPLLRQIEDRPIRRGGGSPTPSAGLRRAFGSPLSFESLDEAAMRRTRQAFQAYYMNNFMLAMRDFTRAYERQDGAPFLARKAVARLLLPLHLERRLVATLTPHEEARIIADYLNAEAAREGKAEKVQPEDVNLIGPSFQVWRSRAPNAVHVIAPFENGQRQYYKVTDPLLYELFAGGTQPGKYLNWLAGTVSGMVEPWKRAITQTLRFAAGNFLSRDPALAGFTGEEVQSLIPMYYGGLGLVARAMRDTPQNLMRSELLSRSLDATTRDPHRTVAESFRDMLSEGIALDEEAQQRPGWHLPGQAMSTLLKPADILNWVTGGRYVSQLSESLTREGAYIASRRGGASEQRAQMAHDYITGHFGQHGTNGNAAALVRMAGFLNPALQIMWKQAALVTQADPKLRAWYMAAKLPALVLWGGIGAAFNTLLMHALYPNEDDRKAAFLQMHERRDEDKFGYMAIGGRIRLPFDYGAIGAATSFGWNLVESRLLKHPTDAAKMAKALLTRARDIPGITDFIEPHAKAGLELYLNHSFFLDDQIVPWWMEDKYKYNPEMQTWPDTPELYNAISGALPGPLKVSPLKIRYAVRQAFARQLDEIITFADRLGGHGRGIESAADVPVVGGLWQRESRGWNSQSVRSMDSLVREYSALKAVRQSLETRGDAAAVADLDARMQPLDAARQAMRRIDDLWKRIKEERKKVAPDYDVITKLEREMTAQARAFLETNNPALAKTRSVPN